MTLNSLCTSLPLSKRLKELGVKIESYFYHLGEPIGHGNREFWQIVDHNDHGSYARIDRVPAYTSSELMDILPQQIRHLGLRAFLTIGKTDDGYYNADYADEPSYCFCLDNSKTFADALAILLIHLIENSYVDPKNPKP